MDSAFFDTNVYNHLNEAQIARLLQLKESGEIEIFTIPQILGELAAGFQTDIANTQRLSGIYGKVISYKIIKPLPELIYEEIEYLNGRKRSSIFFSLSRREEFKNHIENLKKGIIDNNTKNFVKYNKEKKKESKDFCKKSKEKLDKLWNSERVAAFPSFESFHQYAFKTGDVRSQIKYYLERIIHPEQKYLIDKIAKIAERKLNKLPYLGTTVKITSALTYRYHLQKKGAKWGDMEDMLNLPAILTCDIYVSDDGGAREMASLLFPKKGIFSLCSFFEKYYD